MNTRTQPIAAVRAGALPGDPLRALRKHAFIIPATVLWVTLFLVPLCLFVVFSFFRTGVLDIEYVLSVDAYRRVLTDRLYLGAILTTLEIATAVGIGVSAVAFCFCYYVNFVFRRWRELFLTMITIALFSGYLVRIYAWRTILGAEGIVNNTLATLGLIDRPLAFLLYSRLGVMIVLGCMLLPFAILPMQAAFSNVPRELLDAARDLGSGPARAIRTVLLPMAHKGVFSGFAFAFVLTAGDYVTAQLVGGTSTQMVGNIIVDQFGANFDWPLAAAIGVITTLAVAAILTIAALALRRIAR